MASEYPYFHIIPMFQAAAVPGGPAQVFEGRCFDKIAVDASAVDLQARSFQVKIAAVGPKQSGCEETLFFLTTSKLE
eukprot:309791-Prorocentrum_lima.AAC.1